MKEEQPLTIEVKDGRIIISIGVDTLAYALDLGEDVTIIDPAAFAKDIVIELGQESDDGTTVVHTMLDVAANDAIENGSTAVKLVE